MRTYVINGTTLTQKQVALMATLIAQSAMLHIEKRTPPDILDEISELIELMAGTNGKQTGRETKP